MAALEWDSLDERLGYEAGVSHGVFYPSVGPGVVWNGILSIDEDVEGGDTTKHYLDGVAFLTRVEAREFKAKLTALSAPKEFEPYSGQKGTNCWVFTDSAAQKAIQLRLPDRRWRRWLSYPSHLQRACYTRHNCRVQPRASRLRLRH
jgi:hypothetical protein